MMYKTMEVFNYIECNAKHETAKFSQAEGALAVSFCNNTEETSLSKENGLKNSITPDC